MQTGNAARPSRDLHSSLCQPQQSTQVKWPIITAENTNRIHYNNSTNQTHWDGVLGKIQSPMLGSLINEINSIQQIHWLFRLPSWLGNFAVLRHHWSWIAMTYFAQAEYCNSWFVVNCKTIAVLQHAGPKNAMFLAVKRNPGGAKLQSFAIKNNVLKVLQNYKSDAKPVSRKYRPKLLLA